MVFFLTIYFLFPLEEGDDDEDENEERAEEEEEEVEKLPPPPGVTLRDIELFKKVQQKTAEV